MPKNNVILDNLPIYFIWFGSDVPPKYFGNLLKAAQTNKSRDIILVYSEKHLLQNNREKIDSIESTSIDKIQKRIKLKKDSRTKNLFKIDVYDMELNKQDKRIYPLLDKIFLLNYLGNVAKFMAASDVIRLLIISIVGGIYFDMDTKITGEIGSLKTNFGFSFNTEIKECEGCEERPGQKHDAIISLSNFLSRSAGAITSGDNNAKFFNQAILEHITSIDDTITSQQEIQSSAPVRFIDGFFISQCEQKKMPAKDCFNMLSRFGIDLPPTVVLDNKRDYNNRTADHNNPEDLKKLGLDKQDETISSKLEHSSLEQPRNSQEKGR